MQGTAKLGKLMSTSAQLGAHSLHLLIFGSLVLVPLASCLMLCIAYACHLARSFELMYLRDGHLLGDCYPAVEEIMHGNPGARADGMRWQRCWE